jgi:glycosyltransferase involved in cell wall biosynthesis
MCASARGWIAVSQELAEDISTGTGVSIPNRLCVSHNPVDLSEIAPPKFAREQTGIEFRILYTGSVWPMHIDALELAASAVSLLRKKGVRIRLDVATRPRCWSDYKVRLEPLEVNYLGFLDSVACSDELRRGDLLLVAVSFENWLRPFARGSFQTKMTDYMAAGKPILCCGPEASICGNFLERNHCGYFWKSADPVGLSTFLNQIMADRSGSEERARTGRALLERDFSMEKMQRELYDCLLACAPLRDAEIVSN